MLDDAKLTEIIEPVVAASGLTLYDAEFRGSSLLVMVDGAQGANLRTGDGNERSVAYADIDRARTQFEWGPAPKPGKGSKPGKAPKKGSAKKKGPASKLGQAKPATTTSGDDTPTKGHSQP